jgi:hypothetical protein
MPDIDWRYIIDKQDTGHSKKRSRGTIIAFYNALLSAIDYDCFIRINHIGDLRGTTTILKKKNDILKRYNNKIIKRRQRMWAKDTIDKYWNHG